MRQSLIRSKDRASHFRGVLAGVRENEVYLRILPGKQCRTEDRSTIHRDCYDGLRPSGSLTPSRAIPANGNDHRQTLPGPTNPETEMPPGLRDQERAQLRSAARALEK